MLLPGVVSKLRTSSLSEEQIKALEDENTANIALPMKQNFGQKTLKEEDFYRIGVSFQIEEIEQTDRGLQLTIKTIERIESKNLYIEDELILTDYDVSPDDMDVSEKSQEEMMAYIKKITHEISARFVGGDRYSKIIDDFKDLNSLIVYLSQFLLVSNDEKYELMKIQSMKERSLRFIDYLMKQKEVIELQIQLDEKFSEKSNKQYREAVLREHLKAIQKELDEDNEESKKSKDYKTKIEEANMPSEVKEVALEELDKMEAQGQHGSEYNVIRNYLDLLVQMPWEKEEVKPINLGEARGILDEQHYGLEKVKDRIIQHLAVMQLKNDKKGSILLLVGPPGTGKTSLGRSIAEALDRKYIRLSLGGIRDEAEIRGHRRTYIGAMPGRIIQSIKKAGKTNPVMILDEVDKLMTGGYSGDPASALLEVLDPEQNNTFTDHYLDLPYDLSDVFFIATANSTESIPAPLLDRMEVINISSYYP